MITKTLVSIILGMITGLSLLRDSSLVKFLI